jgi:DNA-binding response OmpR family regulator
MKPDSSSGYVAKHLKEIAFDMNLLLVEDDLDLQKQLQTFLSRFFGRVDTACNGVEALMLYDERRYDVILTDLTMPSMGGAELSKRIRWINKSQHIIVLSAHSDGEKLIELINIGIDGFLLKPINMERILQQLHKTSQAIYDHKMLEYFSNTLEEDNQELLARNKELKSVLNGSKTLPRSEPKLEAKAELKVEEDSESTTGRELSDYENMMLYTRSEKMSAAEFHEVYPFELDKTNEDLEILEDNFHHLLADAERNVNHETLSRLTNILRDYAQNIEMIAQFSALAYGIKQLVTTFESIDDVTKLAGIMPMLTSLFSNLEQWRRGILHYRNVEDIHYLDNSLISDALSLQGILSNEHVSSDSDMELF